MCRASGKPSDNFGAGFAAVMAGSTKRYQVFNRVGLGDAPRDNVVHVQTPALACKRIFLPAATFALPFITNARSLGLNGPISAAPVMCRGAALPLGAVASAFDPSARLHIARMAAKSTRFAIKSFELCSALVACFGRRLDPAPARFVIASHIAEAARFSVISERLKLSTATLTHLGNSCFGFPLAPLGPAIPRRPAIRPCASRATVFSCGPASERFAALGACVMNSFHRETITRTRNAIKYFDIACKRVEEATRQPDLFVDTPKAPEQTGFDL